jgi:hypothetical protein
MADMADYDGRALAAAARLRAALDQLAQALGQLQLDAILDAESALETAVVNLPSLAEVSVPARAAIRSELEHARAALARSRRLGAALGDLTAISLEAQGHSRLYGRGHQPLGLVLGGRQLNTTG